MFAKGGSCGLDLFLELQAGSAAKGAVPGCLAGHVLPALCPLPWIFAFYIRIPSWSNLLLIIRLGFYESFCPILEEAFYL
jgi:hypothetical protein